MNSLCVTLEAFNYIVMCMWNIYLGPEVVCGEDLGNSSKPLLLCRRLKRFNLSVKALRLKSFCLMC